MTTPATAEVESTTTKHPGQQRQDHIHEKTDDACDGADDNADSDEDDKPDIALHLAAMDYILKQFLTLLPKAAAKFSELSREGVWCIAWHTFERYLQSILRSLYLVQPNSIKNIELDLPVIKGIEKECSDDQAIRSSLSSHNAAIIIRRIDRFRRDAEHCTKGAGSNHHGHDNNNEDNAGVHKKRSLTLKCSSGWMTDRERLFQHYLKKCIRQDLRHSVRQAWELHVKDETRMQKHGTIISNFPEQILIAVKEQVQQATRNLPRDCQEKVVAASNEEIANFSLEMMADLSTHCGDGPTRHFCSLINDVSLLSELMSAFNKEVLVTSKFLDVAAKTESALAQSSLSIAYHMSASIIRDLCREENPMLSSVGSASWASAPFAVMQRTMATYEKFFLDLEGWLTTDHVFPNILKKLFDSTLQIYINSFLRNTISREEKRDPMVIVGRLLTDHVVMQCFFCGNAMSKYHGVSGFYSGDEVESRMEIIKSIASIIESSKSEPENTLDDVKAVLTQLNADDATEISVMLHLSELGGCLDVSDALRLLIVVAEAKDEIENEQNGDGGEEETFLDERNECVGGSAGRRAGMMNLYNVPEMIDWKQTNSVKLDRCTSERIVLGLRGFI